MATHISIESLSRKWRLLPGNTRGAVWILLGALLATTMFMIVKGLAMNIHIAQIIFFRALVGLVLVIPYFLTSNRNVFRTKRPFMLLATAILALSTLAMSFYAVSNMNLADAIALSFVRPLFLIILAVLFLSEVIRLRRWSATVFGFLGVVVMLRPTGSIEIAAIIALCAAFTAACTVTMMKRLTETESPATQLAYYTTIATLVTVFPAVYVWKTPSWVELSLLIVVGIAGTLNYLCHVQGLRAGEATAVMPVDYIRLIFAALFGFFVFGEVPDMWMWVGATMIVGSTFYITRRGGELKKRESQLPEPG